MTAATRCFLILGALLAPFLSTAHHSLLVYDTAEIVEIEGELVDFFWRNPHVRFSVRVVDEAGDGQLWTAEGPPVNAMTRAGINQAIVNVGDYVRLAAHPSRRHEFDARVVLLTTADGTPYAIDADSVAAFSLIPENSRTVGTGGAGVAATDAADDATGIFRVWTNRDRHWMRDVRDWWARVHPLTVSAQRSLDAWNPDTDDLAAQCKPAGMPEAMMMPFPIEFVDQGDKLLLRIEEWDNQRTVHLNADPNADVPYSRLGYSVGRWEGDTLVVETDRVNYPYFNDQGIPQSQDVRIVERFVLSEDDTKLDWSATLTDPETFTEPVSMAELHWDWIPGQQIQPYNCVIDDAQ